MSLEKLEADKARGRMPKRRVLPADYVARRSLYLLERGRYDWIMQQAAISGADLPRLVTGAMTAIEAEFSIQKAHDNGEFFTPASIVQTMDHERLPMRPTLTSASV